MESSNIKNPYQSIGYSVIGSTEKDIRKSPLTVASLEKPMEKGLQHPQFDREQPPLDDIMPIKYMKPQ